VLAGLLAFMISVLAAFLVYFSWKVDRRSGAAAAGWLLAFVSIFLWARALGPEFGLSYAMIVFICLVWIAVLSNMEGRRADDRSVQRPCQKLQWPELQGYGKHGALFLLSVPAAGVTAMMLSVALVLFLPWALPLKLAVAILLYPVLWGALSAWICAQDTLLKPLLANAGLFALSALVLFV
jgi:hypothetical protein